MKGVHVFRTRLGNVEQLDTIHDKSRGQAYRLRVRVKALTLYRW
jgi:hypothetical protein